VTEIVKKFKLLTIFDVLRSISYFAEEAAEEAAEAAAKRANVPKKAVTSC
jgi:hypothetical protein